MEDGSPRYSVLSPLLIASPGPSPQTDDLNPPQFSPTARRFIREIQRLRRLPFVEVAGKWEKMLVEMQQLPNFEPLSFALYDMEIALSDAINTIVDRVKKYTKCQMDAAAKASETVRCCQGFRLRVDTVSSPLVSGGQKEFDCPISPPLAAKGSPFDENPLECIDNINMACAQLGKLECQVNDAGAKVTESIMDPFRASFGALEKEVQREMNRIVRKLHRERECLESIEEALRCVSLPDEHPKPFHRTKDELEAAELALKRLPFNMSEGSFSTEAHISSESSRHLNGSQKPTPIDTARTPKKPSKNQRAPPPRAHLNQEAVAAAELNAGWVDTILAKFEKAKTNMGWSLDDTADPMHAPCTPIRRGSHNEGPESTEESVL